LNPLIISGLLVTLLILLKIAQSSLHRKRLNNIPHRILVNGSRGKTDVTRLIAAGLRRNGNRVMARTTGVHPTWIDFEGEPHRQTRRVPARIDELIQFIAAAARAKADAVVVECMALNPFLQEITQEKLIRSQVGVITNVRLDHLDVMGKTKGTIAESLALTIPKGGILFTSETTCLSQLEKAAASRNCQLVPVHQDELVPPSALPGTLILENVSLAMAVCRHLGVDPEVALAGMAESLPDEGAFSIVPFMGEQGELYFANALAANDPESTELLLQKAREAYPDAMLVGLFAHRTDRAWRQEVFSSFMTTAPFEKIFRTAHSRDAGEMLTQLEALPSGSLIFAFGNYKGQGEKLIQEIEKRCCPRQ